jgi:hypothetical protein
MATNPKEQFSTTQLVKPVVVERDQKEAIHCAETKAFIDARNREKKGHNR